MVRVAAGGVKVLVGSCWFGVEVRFDVPIDDGDLRVKELDSCRGPISGELDGGMVVVEDLDEFIEMEFPMHPNHKYIFDVHYTSNVYCIMCALYNICILHHAYCWYINSVTCVHCTL